MNAQIRKFLNEEDGITALEYGLMAAVVAGAIVVIVGPQLRTFFSDVFSRLSTAVSGAFS